MPVTIFLSLPHPYDGALNYGLALLREMADPREDRFLCHGDMNETPLQRHSRNLLQGVNSRRDKVLRVMEWVRGITAATPNVHVFSRFFLADYQTPATPARVDNFLELVWLYFRHHEPRLVFVDFADALGGAEAHCAEKLRQQALDEGKDPAAANRLAEAYRQEWSFSPEMLFDRAGRSLDRNRMRLIRFDDSGKARTFLDNLHDTVFCGRAASISPLWPSARAIVALERLMGREDMMA
jgi:hypothetical protein